jgi:hypothetical protein
MKAETKSHLASDRRAAMAAVAGLQLSAVQATHGSRSPHASWFNDRVHAARAAAVLAEVRSEAL